MNECSHFWEVTAFRILYETELFLFFWNWPFIIFQMLKPGKITDISMWKESYGFQKGICINQIWKWERWQNIYDTLFEIRRCQTVFKEYGNRFNNIIIIFILFLLIDKNHFNIIIRFKLIFNSMLLLIFLHNYIANNEYNFLSIHVYLTLRC